MSETLSFRGSLFGHGGPVTSVAATPADPNLLLSASHDNSVIVWQLAPSEAAGGGNGSYGRALRSLRGHDHVVSEVVISSDGRFALSGSWDGTLRLWDIGSGALRRIFLGHTNAVLSVALSGDGRRIVSASRDKTVKVWNAVGECAATLGAEEGGHSEWASCVRFGPVGGGPGSQSSAPLLVSCGRDRLVKSWDLAGKTLRDDHVGHAGYLNAVCVSPDGGLCASGGQDGAVDIWDLDDGKQLGSLDAGGTIRALVFSPKRYWLCAAVDGGIKIWDLESKSVVDTLGPEDFGFVAEEDGETPRCTSLAWSADGATLYAGYLDNVIRVFDVAKTAYVAIPVFPQETESGVPAKDIHVLPLETESGSPEKEAAATAEAPTLALSRHEAYLRTVPIVALSVVLAGLLRAVLRGALLI